jgi:hypothetical protein
MQRIDASVSLTASHVRKRPAPPASNDNVSVHFLDSDSLPLRFCFLFQGTITCVLSSIFLGNKYCRLLVVVVVCKRFWVIRSASYRLRTKKKSSISMHLLLWKQRIMLFNCILTQLPQPGATTTSLFCSWAFSWHCLLILYPTVFHKDFAFHQLPTVNTQEEMDLGVNSSH